MVPPDAGDLVEQRLGGVRVGDDVGHGKIRGHIGLRQRAEGDDDEERLREGGRAAEIHEPDIAARGTEQRQRPLHQRDGQREDQRKMSEFGNHALAA